MARWRLTAKHYLNVPGTTWRHEETSRETGERQETLFPVPKYLDPDDPKFCDRNGDLIVCHEGKGQRGDTTFIGSPTPDMEPLDDEAEAITAPLRARWEHPIEGLPAQGDFSQSLFAMFQKQLDTASCNAPTIPNISAGVDPKAFEELQNQMAAVMAKNAELEAAISKPAAERRV